MRRVRALTLAGLLVLAASSAQAQVCGQCPDASPLAYVCTFEAPPPAGQGCGGSLKVCQKPIASHRIDVNETAPGIYEARLVARVYAPWNSHIETLSSAKLHLYWQEGSAATHPTTSLCQNNTSDQLETFLVAGGLSCSGAPYNLGVYSLRAIVCQGAGACQQITDLNALQFTVTKQTLGCPEPPKWSCGGDSNCRECITVGQGAASPAGEGASAEPDGHGAAVRYRAGGAGGPG